MSQILERGHSIVGIDQAKGMLARAKEKFPLVQFEKIGLQVMSFENLFDGRSAWTPWSNFVPKTGWSVYLYFTVEIQNKAEVKAAFEEARQAGLPVVYVNGSIPMYTITIRHSNKCENGFSMLDIPFMKKVKGICTTIS